MIQEADSQVMDAYNAQNPNGSPQRGCHIVFSMEPEQNFAKSEEAGRPIFEDVEYITIMVPGDKDNMPKRPVRWSDKQQYAQQYAAFKANKEQVVEGTPLSSLPFMSKAQVLEFQAVGLRTAEQVRDMSDSIGQKFIGIHSLKKRVTDFLEAAAGAAPLTKMRAELEARDNEIEVLRRAVKDQGDKLAELTKRR
jgi:hypothetical protein